MGIIKSLDKRLDAKRIKKNWFLPFSAVCFLLLSAAWSLDSVINIIIAFVAFTIVAISVDDVIAMARPANIFSAIFFFLSAAGICLGGQFQKYGEERYYEVVSFVDIRDMAFPVPLPVKLIVMAIGMFFAFLMVSVFWKKLVGIFKTSKLFDGVTKTEIIIYIAVFVMLMMPAILAFPRTQFVYGTDYDYDILYMADSPFLFKTNVWVTLTNIENDIRQPLFAVFAAPFCGISYFFTTLIPMPLYLKALLVLLPQVALLVFTEFIIARLLKLRQISRILTVVLLSFCFAPMLFAFMFEQYPVVVFYTVFLFYVFDATRKTDDVLLAAAAGTCVTGGLFYLLFNESHPFKETKKWFSGLLRSIACFIGFILAFGRISIILGAFEKLLRLVTDFSSASLTPIQKIQRYTCMVQSFFIAPKSIPLKIIENGDAYPSWELTPDYSFSVIGIIIIAVAIAGFILTRKEFVTRIAGIWVLFSIFITVIVGWGMKENGLVLYTLYFGWAYFILVFKAFKFITDKINKPSLNYILLAAATCSIIYPNALMVLNIMHFGMRFYPV